MSDGALFGAARKLLVGANRDVTTLAAFGFSQARIDALAAMRVGFADMLTDVELSAMMMDATQLKQAKRVANTTYVMLQIMQRVECAMAAIAQNTNDLR